MQITGAQLFVKALKEEGVEVLFGYPASVSFPPATNRDWFTPPTATPAPPADPESAS